MFISHSLNVAKLRETSLTENMLVDFASFFDPGQNVIHQSC